MKQPKTELYTAWFHLYEILENINPIHSLGNISGLPVFEGMIGSEHNRTFLGNGNILYDDYHGGYVCVYMENAHQTLYLKLFYVMYVLIKLSQNL